MTPLRRLLGIVSASCLALCLSGPAVADPSATSTASAAPTTTASAASASATAPQAQVTFGGGRQADGSRPPGPTASDGDDSTEWLWGGGIVAVGAAGGWVLWRRRTGRAEVG